jgi:hypothetical protein
MLLHEDRSYLAACEARCSPPRKDMKLRIEPPLYMIGMKILCWRCQSKMPVIALLAPHVANTDGQVCVLGHIEEMPEKILRFIQQKVPTFRFRTSQMGGSRYFANGAIHFAQVDVVCSLWASREHMQSVVSTTRRPFKSSTSGLRRKMPVRVTLCEYDGHRVSDVPGAVRKRHS